MKFRAKGRRYSKKRKSPAIYRQQKQQHDQQQQQPDDQQPCSSTGNESAFRQLSNKSENKIKNSDLFNKSFITESPSKKNRRLTRSLTENLGFRQTSSFQSKYEMIDIELLNSCLQSAALCRSCKNSKGKLFIRQRQSASFGLSKKLEIACTTCNFVDQFHTSERLSSSSSTKKFDINVRSVYASQTIGHTGLSEFCSIMGLSQPINKNSYQEISSEICNDSSALANEMMKKSAKKLIQQQYGEDIDQLFCWSTQTNFYTAFRSHVVESLSRWLHAKPKRVNQ